MWSYLENAALPAPRKEGAYPLVHSYPKDPVEPSVGSRQEKPVAWYGGRYFEINLRSGRNSGVKLKTKIRIKASEGS